MAGRCPYPPTCPLEMLCLGLQLYLFCTKTINKAKVILKTFNELDAVKEVVVFKCPAILDGIYIIGRLRDF